jgi:hypothetical protein
VIVSYDKIDKYLKSHDNIIFVMREVVGEHKKEFEELVGSLSQTTTQMQDPVAIGLMLYSIAEERKSTNLIIKELNAKIDGLVDKVVELEKQTHDAPQTGASSLSGRDIEVLEYVNAKGRICADELMEKFQYKGKNAASARLSRLFHEGRLEKEYAGRTVYYKVK